MASIHPAVLLARWCVKTGTTQVALARLLGVAQSTANRMLHRQFCPSAKLAEKIEAVSGLPADLWLPHRVKKRFRALVKDAPATVAA